MSSKLDADVLVEAIVLDGVRLSVFRASSSYISGSGRRALRAWMRYVPCCAGSRLAHLEDGRWCCGNCGRWFSASHSHNLLALAQAKRPIGVDVQCNCDRPSALRWLARSSGLDTATIAHWTLAESALKAVGQANSRPTDGWATLPQFPTQSSCLTLKSGAVLEFHLLCLDDASVAVCHLISSESLITT